MVVLGNRIVYRIGFEVRRAFKMWRDAAQDDGKSAQIYRHHSLNALRHSGRAIFRRNIAWTSNPKNTTPAFMVRVNQILSTHSRGQNPSVRGCVELVWGMTGKSLISTSIAWPSEPLNITPDTALLTSVLQEMFPLWSNSWGPNTP